MHENYGLGCWIVSTLLILIGNQGVFYRYSIKLNEIMFRISLALVIIGAILMCFALC